jgi:indolepyruvate ferredoxin oxidoreductase
MTNEPLKREFGPWIVWVLRMLARLKGVRGTYLDVFAHTAERRTERRLPEEYCSAIRALLADLDSTRHATAVRIARLPEQIRGFGHVKRDALLRVIEEEQRLWTRLNGAGFRSPHGFARAMTTERGD